MLTARGFWDYTFRYISVGFTSFTLLAAAKLVQTERKTKFYLSFSEVKPNFLMQSSKKIVRTEKKSYFPLLSAKALQHLGSGWHIGSDPHVGSDDSTMPYGDTP